MKVKTIQKILSAILFLLSCNVALSQEQIGVAAAVNKNTVDLTPEERLLVATRSLSSGVKSTVFLFTAAATPICSCDKATLQLNKKRIADSIFCIVLTFIKNQSPRQI